MAQEQFAFDDWQKALQQIQVKNEVGEQPTKPETQISQEIKQQQEKQSKKKIEDPKQILRLKIAEYKGLSEMDFQQKYGNKVQSMEKAIKILNHPILMKSDKDFIQHAKQVASRMSDQTVNDEPLPDNYILQFFQELLLLLYNSLDFSTIDQIQKKIKIVKNQRKQIQNKKKKEYKKVQNTPNVEVKVKIQEVAKQDNLFGGVEITHKQEQPFKEKEAKKVPVKQQVEDDDDFM